VSLKPTSVHEPILSLKNVWVHFDGVPAIRGVSLEVRSGNIAGIIGANGAGKTTILRTISNVKKLTSGVIIFAGQRIDKTPPYAIVKLGAIQVLEGRRIFPHLSVEENLKVGAYVQRDMRKYTEDIANIMELFPELRGKKNQKGASLSGGEQQMLAIGRALMARPKLLLLDEPSLGLAPLIIKHLSDTIKEVNRRGVSILLAEQNTRLAFQVAHWGFVIQSGEIVLQGNTRDLLDNEGVRRAYLGT
jgi:branched-chain amino acid transport system ATP-binding protein